MGLLDAFNFFKRKPKEEEMDYSSVGLATPSLGPTTTPTQMTSEFATQENMKAKLDLMMTQIDSMRIQHESMNERIVQIEKMVRQLLDMAAKTPKF